MPHVAVVLSGCGHLDGTEVREACYTLLALDQEGATFQCFAPDKPQVDVVDHTTGEPVPGETRNVLLESARIARGEVQDLRTYDAARFDALVFPGGFGGAKNLSDFAVAGAKGTVDPDVRAAVEETHRAGKPIGFICITPASVGALCLGDAHTRLTVGDDEGTARAIEAAGGVHVTCPTDEAVVDDQNRIVSTPAYMDGAARPGAVYDGISALVRDVVKMTAVQTVPS